VAAGNYRRLENNMSLLVQLAFFETLLDCKEINNGPKKYEAVTAADIKRVANSYFSPANRSVAVYRRAAAAGQSGAKAEAKAGAKAGAKE